MHVVKPVTEFYDLEVASSLNTGTPTRFRHDSVSRSLGQYSHSMWHLGGLTPDRRMSRVQIQSNRIVLVFILGYAAFLPLFLIGKSSAGIALWRPFHQLSLDLQACQSWCSLYTHRLVNSVTASYRVRATIVSLLTSFSWNVEIKLCQRALPELQLLLIALVLNL